ncbi:MAG: Mu P family protein [Hyphomicrobiales bacterium]|nr:MAG: Mu P family protein [Hyphomicrobiales bacterium]
MEIEGVGTFDAWTIAEVTRDLQDFAGTFSFTLRDATRAIASFDYASPPPLFQMRPGPGLEIYLEGELILVGWIENVDVDIDAEFGEVTISGRDKSGDLVDSAAAPDGPGEFKNIKLEDAAKKIAAPFDLTVKTEIDTGEPFPRYPIGVAETALSAIEKGARQRHALVTSDGKGGIVITRSGKEKAPGDLTLPGNILSSSGHYSHERRHSETIVRGQSEKAEGRRKKRKAKLKPGDPALDGEARALGDGSATTRERKGIAITGRTKDPEITRHRPKVHLTKSQPSKQGAQDEADFRSRAARANGEEVTVTVHSYSVNGILWKVNQLPNVNDAFQGINRDMLISRIAYRYAEDEGEITEMTVMSPEAFDKKSVGNRRKNSKRGKKKSGPLDGTARAL